PLALSYNSSTNVGEEVYDIAARPDGGFDLIVRNGSQYSVRSYDLGGNVNASTVLPYNAMPVALAYSLEGERCVVTGTFGSYTTLSLLFGDGAVTNIPLGAPGTPIGGPNGVDVADDIVVRFTGNGTVLLAVERMTYGPSGLEANVIQFIEAGRDGMVRVVGEIEGPTGAEELNGSDVTDIHVLADGSFLVA
ncbi:MAG: hypothetical protein JNN26_27300, partial [Candidatus Obscuribacter sp.]|nr:hypothetical protein [Candidatus Obscuribacter sp.]